MGSAREGLAHQQGLVLQAEPGLYNRACKRDSVLFANDGESVWGTMNRSSGSTVACTAGADGRDAAFTTMGLILRNKDCRGETGFT